MIVISRCCVCHIHWPFATTRRHNFRRRRLNCAKSSGSEVVLTGYMDHLGTLTLRDKEELAGDAIVYATEHGLVVGLGLEEVPCAVVHAPLAVLPTEFPRSAFSRAKEVMPLMNSLADAVSKDDDYLQMTLTPAGKYDPFTAQLLRIHADTRQVRASRRTHQLVLAINRSDYMLDQSSARLLQVELNTIASSFGALSSLVRGLHAFTLSRASCPEQALKNLPENKAMEQIAAALGSAARESGVPNAVVVMVVQPRERNIYDQQWLQTRLWEDFGVRTLRATLAQIADEGRLEASGQLLFRNCLVGVVYFRAGYSPDDYPSDKEWRSREMLESSTAVLCPSVAYQLAGAKKVQQDLARPGVLERFVSAPAEAARLREHFAGLWGLDDLSAPETAEVIADAVANPGKYVLKPQREGGGNNLYGEALREKLQEGRGLAAYILMQRLFPPLKRSLMIRKGESLEADVVSEVGVYGTFMRRGDEILLNAEAGHLVRTKAANSDEGGVAAGFAVLDSPYLLDD
eukprot:jgi/Botrbrau1/19581/Bobra.0035s0064.1